MYAIRSYYDPDGTEELYDHEQDPYEFNNIEKEPGMLEIKNRLKKYIPKKWEPSTGGRLEVNRDLKEVMRDITPNHRKYISEE